MPLSTVASLGLDDEPRLVLKPSAQDLAAGRFFQVQNPATLETLAGVRLDDAGALDRTIERSRAAFLAWREVPAPVRGQIIREIGESFRAHKVALGRLVSIETGKVLSEGEGEVQEAIDIAEFAAGLSRTIGGPTIPSERAKVRIFEQWHPLGPIGVITAFNFPAAVWAWNAMIAAVCGDTVLWKPSLAAPITACAMNRLATAVATRHGHPALFSLVIGTDDQIGERLIADRRLPLISATGSCRMGRRVASVVGARLGRTLLELGGNNAAIVEPSADLDLALKSVVFAAVGTAGQRCTTTRRLFVHESIADDFVQRLVAAYRTITIGNPVDSGVLVGPLINRRAVESFDAAISQARAQGATLLTGGKRCVPLGTLAGVGGAQGPLPGHFVEPAILRCPGSDLPIAREETFAPILYVFTYRDLEDAIARNNSVDQGLSSAIFTDSVRASERFLSASGSDCGLAYVNLGTSGAEIGGAFGGEKDTGGGRESGSDSWKAYMRRQTCSVSHAATLALAQGIRFG
ncbi:MAG: aldehyde dehydrogenase family protein [Planctomycetota bacterium]|nr:aldehyde dehydrogenase family protein [Planctomycetota bacterium]